MEKLEQYRHYVKQVITEYSQIGSSKDPIEQQLIFDTVGDHYQLMYVGWKNRRRYHGCVLHLDIKKGKIWIQHDGAPKMSYRYFDKIEMHPNYPYSSSFHTKTRRANSPNLIIRLSDKQDQ